ncbi:MAG: ribosome biogenesis GTPase Der [Chloroflexi bacterium]|nr:MAG: ribosome biogenesis GTPase Der [Chloroflexota bacterium]MBL1197134.1 ribosome biogenesis GTPase Der [Chloroflexota bacterium]NOH14429.1 ribosome biogenesis GTPase Der [Chloroflexota bacterium]
MIKPVVALVGRPNVGKSTLFNRLAGRRLAVVDDVPGTTRDRLHTEADWAGLDFIIVDTGGIDPSRMKKGEGGEPLSIGSADFIDEIRAQAEAAIREADAVLFLVDVENGVTPADLEVSEILRRFQSKREGTLWPSVILVVNKAENKTERQQAVEFYELGMGEPYAVSAMHGGGVGDMLDALVEALKVEDMAEPEDEEDDSVKIAIVGKPNVGKSSLLNRILGEDRAIVSPIAGTTRDSVDSYITHEDVPITLIDTAGIRRRGKIEPGVEKYSVIRSMRSISRADVALLLLDATTGITSQDAHIAGYILDEWKSAVVVVNKWDAIEKDTHTINEYEEDIREQLNFLPYVPIKYISALTGQRVNQVIPAALHVQEERMVRLSTSQVNKILRDAMAQHSPPSKGGRLLKIFYGAQVQVEPPTFVLHVNDPKLMHFTYKRFLENRIRDTYGFMGTPIRIIVRARKKVELA